MRQTECVSEIQDGMSLINKGLNKIADACGEYAKTLARGGNSADVYGQLSMLIKDLSPEDQVKVLLKVAQVLAQAQGNAERSGSKGSFGGKKNSSESNWSF